MLSVIENEFIDSRWSVCPLVIRFLSISLRLNHFATVLGVVIFQYYVLGLFEGRKENGSRDGSRQAFTVGVFETFLI